MMNLPRNVFKFFEKQGFVILSTLDKNGSIHTSAKGMLAVKEEGKVILLDMYYGITSSNIKRDSRVSITAVDGHSLEGYCLKGQAKLLSEDEIKEDVIQKSKDRIAKRITERILTNVKSDKKPLGHHPEAKMPHPKYLIEVSIEEIIDLTPKTLKP